MLQLYNGGGANDFYVLEDAFPPDQWRQFKTRVHRLLISQGKIEAARMLLELPFLLSNGSNGFNDEFYVLQALVPFDTYLEYSSHLDSPWEKQPYRDMADGFTKLGAYVRFVALDYLQSEGLQPVEEPTPRNASAAVELALADARYLLAKQGPLSAIDRAHTAFHGYLLDLCSDAGIAFPVGAPLTQIFKLLRAHHSKFSVSGPFADELNQIVRPLGAVIDACNHLRNRASLAHPNDPVLKDAESKLVLDAIRSLFNYIQSKVEFE